MIILFSTNFKKGVRQKSPSIEKMIDEEMYYVRFVNIEDLSLKEKYFLHGI